LAGRYIVRGVIVNDSGKVTASRAVVVLSLPDWDSANAFAMTRPYEACRRPSAMHPPVLPLSGLSKGTDGGCNAVRTPMKCMPYCSPHSHHDSDKYAALVRAGACRAGRPCNGVYLARGGRAAFGRRRRRSRRLL